MRLIKEQSLFFRRAMEDLHGVGSIIPSSRMVARSMTAAMRQKSAPRRILEVGAGTGPITAQIVRDMRAGDQLDIYEIDPQMSTFLAGRFEREAAFRRVQSQVTIYTDSITNIEAVARYDIIISAVPFSNLPPAGVTDFFETYRAILKPEGVLTFIEFALGRVVLSTFAKRDERARMKAVGQVVKRYREQYQCRQRFVPLNVPPARIYSLQFG